MSDADKIRDELVKALLLMRDQTRTGHVGLNVTGEYNRIIQLACQHLNLHIHELGVTEGERNIALFRHADDPVSRRPITAEEKNRCLMDGDAFRAKLEEAITAIYQHVPPRDPIGFRR